MGMMIKFRIVDFPRKDGNERAVEVLSQVEFDASYPLPPPSQSPLNRKWCKVGWVHIPDIGDVDDYFGKFGVVSQLLKDDKKADIRKLHYTLNGAASFFMLASEIGGGGGVGGGGGGGSGKNLKRVIS